MWRARVLDPDHPIIELTWSGRVEGKEVEEANNRLSECVRSIGGRPFDLLVDTSGLIAFMPDAQRALVEHQKWLIGVGMKRAAVITPNAVVNIALDATRKRSGHTQEYKFPTREEALAFLKKPQA